MRAIVFLTAAGLLSGCTSTLTSDPKLTLSPYLAVYQLRGDTSVSTDPGGGAPLQNNPPEPLSLFGQDHHEDDVGLRADFGNGFAGLRADYYRLDMSTSDNGILPADWGALQAGDLVRMNADMDELRLSWVEQITSIKTTLNDEDLTLSFAAGGQFTYRALNLRAKSDNDLRTQNVAIDGEMFAIANRMRVAWRDLFFDIEYAFSPDLTIQGDYTGFNQDFELRGNYAIPLRDITFFAGYRYSSLEADGTTQTLPYSADLQIDGFQFGMTISL